MIEAVGVAELSAGELALQLHVMRGTAVYAAYLAARDEVAAALTELEEELRGFDADENVARSSPHSAEELVAALAGDPAEIIVVDASSLSAEDWAVLDRRRSSIAHRGVLVFVMTPESFDELMRRAPNLASWLGGQVFAYPDEKPRLAAHRERRLATLRAWASRSDAEVIAAAREGTLPRDPEYAEWLVLLGHGELLDSRAP